MLSTVSSPKQRTLIAALLLRSNTEVPSEELRELLWPGRPVERAQISLHTLISRTRRELRRRGVTGISSLSSGYAIDTTHDELDLNLFERACERGRHAWREGNWARASAALRQGLDLWRGEFLSDVTVPELQEPHRGPLIEQRLQALELRIDAELELGESGALVKELRQLVMTHPLRERFHALLLLALYRSGQRADALAAFREARRLMVDELGVEPGWELQELHQRVLTDDPSLLTTVIKARPR
ncbi:AfsR/SARP family transcriptional regulator [Streptomyces litchfieldiae]|uniref:AfsR/SARP family transcriptional regulator n=1 Tax=Streptomyces litchfieldiae TaxID=3075543 RepID=A0ABU2MPS7_9ACTN|nr:AfsR/SARP family transcriptional regulator [Streptomyces sp. DSM 44938]MDT0343616.1 AfsR/SARP family transcriptional regulator [Streptomyces sp. DSM 44938]